MFFIRTQCITMWPNVSVPLLWGPTVSNQWQSISEPPLWRSNVSNQWSNVVVPIFWQFTVSNQRPNVSVFRSGDLLCQTSDQTSQHSSLMTYCVQSVTKHLSTPSLTI